MTSRFVGRPTRLAFVILASIAPVISLGDDGMHLRTAPVPSKTLPPPISCPPWGSVTAYQPTWHEGQTLSVRVQFATAGDAANVQGATLCYSYPDTPACTYVSPTNLSCSGLHLSANRYVDPPCRKH